MENPNIKCDICDGNCFTPRDGFYYCDECGTQSQVVRQVIIEDASGPDKFSKSKVAEYGHSRTRKIKVEEVQITSWECFNYVLRGLVEELIELGAKDDLKLATLQLWATYLRTMEVAFFSRKTVELPRLGVKYSKRDAKILYNHEIRKKRKVEKVSNPTAQRVKKRVLTSHYESVTETSASSLNTSGLSSFRSSQTNQAVPLNFSSAARKHFKKFMHKSHLKKHTEDDKLEMKCHQLSHNVDGIKYTGEVLCRRTLYTILYLALNLVGDDIQLADMLRFMRENHVASENVSHFFPDNVTDQCMNIMKSKAVFGRTHFYSYRLRKSVFNLCKFLHIGQMKTPDISKLVQRYVEDLNLPTDVSTYINRLIKIYPPEMNLVVTSGSTPSYEARAMAYIVFVLKLLFGLDGSREMEISSCARNVNKRLQGIGYVENGLFVFEDWQRYIEMRTIIISQGHLPTSLHFKEYVDRDNYVDNLKEVTSALLTDADLYKRPNLHSMELIFERIYNIHKTSNDRKEIINLQLPPSMKPYSSYLKEMITDTNVQENIYIPSFMFENHSELDIGVYLKPSKLKSVFNKSNINLLVERLPCNQNVKMTKIFKGTNPDIVQRKSVQVRRICHDVDEEEWVESIRNKNKRKFHVGEDSESSDSDDQLTTLSTKNVRSRKRQASETLVPETSKIQRTEEDTERQSLDDTNLLGLSFQVFDETNMEPLESLMKDILQNPRRNLSKDNSLFTDSNDEDNDDQETFEESVTFKVSNSDYWCYLVDMRYLTNDQVSELETKFQPTFFRLMNTLASIIEADFRTLYQELLIIESNLIYKMELVADKTCTIKRRQNRWNEKVRNAIDAYARMW